MRGAASIDEPRLQLNGAPSPAMDESSFSAWAELIEEQAGLSLTFERRGFLERRIEQRMEALQIDSMETYWGLLNSGTQGRIEWCQLIDLLTVHETFFFRHPAALAFIREQVLPDYFRTHSAGSEFQAWSVGCASGEEAYSLAMVIDAEHRNAQSDNYFAITATDISYASLAKARQAIYPEIAAKHIDVEYRVEYLEGPNSGYFRVAGHLRKRICFTNLNLLDLEHWPLNSQHLIYCQNVLIYFERTQRAQILDHLIKFLHPGGVLILGAGEAVGWSNPAAAPIAHSEISAFRKQGQNGSAI